MSTPDFPTPTGSPYGPPTGTVTDAAPATPYAPGPGTPSPAPSRRSNLAVAAFVVGLVSVLVCLIPVVNVISVVGGLVAVVLAVVALRKLAPGVAGKGFAITGLVLGAVSVVVAVLMLVVIGMAAVSLDESGELDAILQEVEAAQEVDAAEAVAPVEALPAEAAAPADAAAGAAVAADVVREDFSGVDCDVLGAEAVAMSEGAPDGEARLLDVRESVPVEDHRTDYAVPTGVDESLVLSCRGTAAWDDATQTPVLTELTIDADGDQYVFYAGE